jgi:hypothetical protein
METQVFFFVLCKQKKEHFSFLVLFPKQVMSDFEFIGVLICELFVFFRVGLGLFLSSFLARRRHGSHLLIGAM